MTKTMTITDFLTEEQIKQAQAIYEEAPNGANVRIRDEIIAPNMDAINKKLGQENDADYLAYAVEHVLTQASR